MLDDFPKGGKHPAVAMLHVAYQRRWKARPEAADAQASHGAAMAMDAATRRRHPGRRLDAAAGTIQRRPLPIG